LDETTKEIVERLRAATKADEANQTPRPDTTRAMIISDDRWIAADIITSLSERVGELERLARKLRGGLNDEDDIHINRAWIRAEVDALLSKQEER